MHLILICDTFVPKRNSGAIQLKDLAYSITSKNNSLTVFTVGNKKITKRFKEFDTIYVNPIFNNSRNYFLRLLSELSYSYYFKLAIRDYLKKNEKKIDGIIFYSPTIFFGPLVNYYKRKLRVKSFLILRDIFPNWAIDLGIIKNPIIIFLLKYFSSYQYQQADYIGVQANSNIDDARYWIDDKNLSKLVNLYNWLTPPKVKKSSFKYLIKKKVNHFNKKIFIYAGNVGDAQDLDLFIDVAVKLQSRNDILFLIIGRGKKLDSILQRVNSNLVNNISILDEIENNKLFELLPLCYAGIISLHKNHKLDNIPGKLLSYLSVGIPVIGAVNNENELIELNRKFNYGLIFDSNNNINDIVNGVIKLVENKNFYVASKKNSLKLFNTLFKTNQATSIILDALK